MTIYNRYITSNFNLESYPNRYRKLMNISVNVYSNELYALIRSCAAPVHLK